MKIIVCGNEHLVTVLQPMYQDKTTRHIAFQNVLSKLLSDTELNKLIDAQILSMYDTSEKRIGWASMVLQGLGPKVAKKIDSAELEKLIDIEILRVHSCNTVIREEAGSIVVSQFIESIGKEEFARLVDEDILNFVISKDIPVYIDTTGWPDDRVRALCKKIGLPYIPLLSRDQAEALVASGDIDGYKQVEYKIVESDDFSKTTKDDRTFRDAWCFCPKKGVQFNMARAQEIHMQEVRRVRNARLAEIDIEINKAEDADKPDINAIKGLRKKRQELRDVPQTLDLSSAKTPDDFKKMIPAVFR